MNAVVPFLEASAISDLGLRAALEVCPESLAVLEDNDAVRHSAVGILRGSGKQQPITLLLVDLVMPGMNGREVAQKLPSSCPDLRVVYTSGYDQAARANNSEPVLLFRKPFTRGALLQKVHEAFDSVPGPTFKTGSPS